MIKVKKIWIGLLLSVVWILTLGMQTVLAEDGKASIIIEFSVNHHGKPVAGAEFSVFQVLSEKDGAYSIDETFAEAGLEVTEILSLSEHAANLLAKLPLENTIRGITEKDGKLTFSGLENGIWLVSQTGCMGEAREYQYASPCLVKLSAQESGTASSFMIYPKTAKTEVQIMETQKPETEVLQHAEQVRTEDDYRFVLNKYLMLALTALLSGTTAWKGKRKI